MIDIEQQTVLAPPHSHEAEQSVLGAVLIDAEVIDDITGCIEPHDFYYPHHRMIFATMLSMTGQPIDVVTLADASEEIDIDYLVSIAKNTPSSSNVEIYAKIVVERSKERQLMSVGQLFNELCNDPDLSHSDRIEQAQIAFAGLSSERQADTQINIKTAAEKVLEGIDNRFNGIEDGKQICTGLSTIDNRIQGFRSSDLILVGARPSMGKTTYMTNIAVHAARMYGTVMIFSLESPAEQLTERMFASIGRVHLDLIRNPKKSTRDESFWPKLTFAVNGIKDLPIIIDDQGGLSVYELKSRARRQHRKTPISMVMVDYIGKLNDGSKKMGDSRNSEIGNISAELKLLAKELECPVVALSQLNRSLENRPDKRPKNSDLRDSGSLEQDADIIQFLYRDEVYDEQTQFKGVLEVITAKFRDGAIGTDRVLFEGQYNSITDMDAAKFMQQQEEHQQSSSKYEYK